MAEFTAYLTADVFQPDEVIHVSTNLGARSTYPWRLVVGDEVMYVTGGVVAGEESGIVWDGLTWTVGRGADDTDPTVHLAGTLVEGTPVGQFTTDEPMIEDGSSPAVALTGEDGTDWLRTDPESTGV